jgi:hypothetical protein
MLDEDQAPPPPEWTGSFFVPETSYSGLSAAIQAFQNNLTATYWYQDPYSFPVAGEFPSQVEAEIEAWFKQNRYLAHQLMYVQYRSFDFESDSRAIVTARETWLDKLFEYGLAGPDYFEDTLVGERGPYDLDVTYTVEFDGDRWQVTNIVYQTQPPDW